MENFKKYSIYDSTEIFATNCTTPLFGVIKSVCEHSWVNTGMTLQGVSLKRCVKCGKQYRLTTLK